MEMPKCPYCKHSLKDNSHGVDQNDFNGMEYSGRCTYCKECRKPINPDNLIPPDSELGQLLLQWAEDFDASAWKIANVANELIAELEGGVVKKKDVYRVVAARCKGKQVNTIRRWAEIAADFDEELQAKYAGLLSFEHFKAARRLYNEGLTPNLEYALKWCVEGNDYKLQAGKFHTVGQLYAEFVPEYRTKTLWERIKEDLYDSFLLEDNDTDRERLLDAWGTITFIQDKKKEV